MKTAARRKNGKSVIYNDLGMIKKAFLETGSDIRGMASDMVSKQVDEMRGRSKKLKNSLQTYTKQKPFKTVGIAVLSGLLLGYFIHR